MAKILPLIVCCDQECPNHHYDSGGRYECTAVRETVPAKGAIPSFCPLADYPSHELAKLEATVRELREPFNRPMVVTVLSHIAAKFGVPLGTDSGQVAFKLEDETSVTLRYDHITMVEVDMNQWRVHFKDQGREYSVTANERPHLQVKVQLQGSNKEGWQNCYLKK